MTAKLKPVASDGQWSKGLERFRKRHQLPWRALTALLNGTLSRRSLHRICKGNAGQIRHESQLRASMLDHIRAYLEGKGYSPKQIQEELRTIFREEEVLPVITQRVTLTKGAQNHFGLRFDPFTSDPRNMREVFTTPRLDRIAAQLEDAIRYQGFVAVVGDVGSGKSLIKKRVVDACRDSKGKLVILWPQFFNMELVHSASITTFILRHFQQPVPSDRVYRAERLRKFLESLSEEGIRVALGFDECHRLHPNLISALKNFWELGSGGFDRYLGLILFGQPKFENVLRNIDFREIAERLEIVRMPDLSKQNDAWDYVTLRLKVAGGSADKLFDRTCIDRLTIVAPTPQGLGNLANSALMKAYEFNQAKVTKDILKAVLGMEEDEPRVRAVNKRVIS